MSKSDEESAAKTPFLRRRDVLKAGGVGAVSLALLAKQVNAQETGSETSTEAAKEHSGAGENHRLLSTPPPESAPPPTPSEFQPFERTNSDFMVDVIKTLNFDYMIANPADLLAAFHESLTGPYGGNKAPEWITVTHEEISVAMAHGYYKIEGKPAITSGHSTVGLMHASMAIYNAYCDRVPVYMVFGNQQAPTNHSVLDAASPVRDFIRYYDRPESLEMFAENAVRAYAFAMTPPTMPVLISLDFELQERTLKGSGPRIPKLSVPQPAQADAGALDELAKELAQAKYPVLVPGRYARSQEGIDQLVQLAELLQAPVLDGGARMNFPKRHPLNQSYADTGKVRSQADLILGLEANLGARGGSDKVRTVVIGADDAYSRGNYQEIGHYGPVDLSLGGDPQASMPYLIEAVKRQLGKGQRAAAQARGAELAKSAHAAFEQDRVAATYGWDASPVSVARMCAEIWEAVKDEDWSFVSESLHFGNWPERLWPMEKKYHFLGSSGGGGIGYNAPAATGAALANKKYGRITVNINCDGDLMYTPGVLWTQAHHKIPILTVMHNNRAYHAEAMYLRRAANLHGHPLPRGGIGTQITEPNLDFAKIAQGMGVYAEGPISDPKDLAPALKRALAIVKQGLPALVDVVTQPR